MISDGILVDFGAILVDLGRFRVFLILGEFWFNFGGILGRIWFISSGLGRSWGGFG